MTILSKIKKCDLLIFALVMSGLAFSCGQSTKAGKSELAGKYEKRLEYNKFVDPPATYRSFPFYSLNDQLDTTEIKRQIAGFKDAGFGGFYLHSRDGLLTEFLSDDWWNIMNAAVEAGNENGLHTMFYDEDKWPSGYAGGIIPEMDESFRAKSLVRLDKATPLPAGSVVLKTDDNYNYIEHTAQMGNNKFNGTCYVDLMNPDMVKAFLEVSYRPYIEKYRSKISGYVPGIFADEPHIHARYFDRNTPHKGIYSYSPFVRSKFKRLFGYDLLDKAELLFEEKENWREVRLQYHQAVALQFEESFSRQIAEYCEKNGFIFTGHYLAEDVLEKVRDRAGNTMLHYRRLQQPGIDVLGLGFEGKLITSRALSSVANQYDQPRRLSELFGIGGQNLNFEDRKWIAGWHAITGVNHFCPHLTLYSMTGLRKRDYPPTFSYHQPYWEYNKTIEDYLARISYAATVGKYAPQLLVISPLESEFIKGNNEGEFTKSTLKVLENLQKAHFDYDLGDEQILSDLARIEAGKLRVGSMRYQAVVLPDMIEIRKSTLQLLVKLAKKGGKIIYTGRFPQFFDGIEDTALAETLKKQAVQLPVDELGQKLPELIAPLVRLEGENNQLVWTQVRESSYLQYLPAFSQNGQQSFNFRKAKEGTMVHLFNTSHTQTISIKVWSPVLTGSVVLWDPASSKCFSLEANSKGQYELTLAPSAYLWLTSGKQSLEAQISGPYQPAVPEQKHLVLDGPWQIKRLNDNALTLDFATYSTDGGNSFSQPEPVIGIFGRLSDQGYTGPLTLRYPFIIEEVPANARIAVEHPEFFKQIMINGQPISFVTSDYFIDRAILTCQVSAQLTRGKNFVEMALDFRPAKELSRVASERYGSEIESIYLTGDFAIKGFGLSTTFESQRNSEALFQARPVHRYTSFSVSAEPAQSEGDLTVEGYPFYAGGFELSKTFSLEKIEKGKRYFIEFPNTEAIVSVISLNGTPLDTLFWSPYRVDLTPALKEGENHLTVTLVNSLRNLLGPHHQKRGELTEVGPFSFGGSGGFPDPRGDSRWYDLRLTNQPTRIWTDTYTMIPFGFIEDPIITSE